MRTPFLLALAPVLASFARAQTHDVDAILQEMETLVRPCVQPTSGKRVFVRCFDTHSSIHAHWAAFRIARVVPGLDQSALDSEVALEYAKVRFETPFMMYPYASAWFLRLAIEYEKWSKENLRPDPERLRPVADEIARYLLDHYRASVINPLIGEYLNPSWVLVQLFSYYRFTGDATRLAAVDGLIEYELVQDIEGTSFKKDLQSQQFFSVYGNWSYAVVKTQDPATVDAFLQMQDPIPNGHLHVNQISSSHSYGMGWSRTWALRALSMATTDPHERERLRRAADEHIRVGMERHWVLKGDFLYYDHWVPQFAVYAVTEGLGIE